MILIDNATQSGLLTMRECIDALERAFGAIDSGQAIYRPKTDVNVPNSKMNEYYRFGSMEGWFDAIFAIRFMSEVIVYDHRAARYHSRGRGRRTDGGGVGVRSTG